MSTPKNTFESEPGWTVIKPKPKMSTRKPSQSTTYRKQKYLFNMRYLNKDKTHFIPKNIKVKIDNLFEKGIQVRDLFTEIDKYVNYNASIRPSVVVYILNQAASADKLDIIEYILENIYDRTQIVNVKCGTMAYTPIFKSAYRGSIRAVKMLLCAGADLNSQNTEGETVLEALEQGLADEIGRNPDLEIFIKDRYAECRDFITKFNPSEKVIVFKPYKKKEETLFEDDSTDTDEAFNKDMSISDFISEFSSNEDKFKQFISDKDVTQTLIEMFTFIFDKGLNEECLNIIKIIKILATNDSFKQNIIDCFQDETIQETIQFDAPYAKDEINQVCNILQIETIK